VAARVRRTRIVIFAKAPVPGQAKTRLAPALGEIGAARLAKRMLDRTVVEAEAAGLAIPELCATPHPFDEDWKPFPSDRRNPLHRPGQWRSRRAIGAGGEAGDLDRRERPADRN
jgi:hypothetical protein